MQDLKQELELTEGEKRLIELFRSFDFGQVTVMKQHGKITMYKIETTILANPDKDGK